MKKNLLIKKTIYISIGVMLSIVTSLSPVIASAQSQAAVDCATFEQFLSLNDDRGFYNPCVGGGACSTGSGVLTGPPPTELKGESNAEKTWNYFVGRGLSPIAAAGALGNIEKESGFDPWIGEGGTVNIDKSKMLVGFGLIQWTNTDGNAQGRRYSVMKFMEDSGLKLDATDPSQNDAALLAQLNWLWDGEYGGMTWQEQLNTETSVSGNTSINPMSAEANAGNGSALYFHASVERSNDSPERLQGRIDSAQKYLDQFGSGGSDSNCSVGEGGLTEDQAKKLMDFYRNDPNAASVRGMDWFFNPGPGDCNGKPNCTAFTTYFIGKYTSLEVNAMGDGLNKVDNLLGINPGAQSGDTPKPFAAFQTGTGGFGHTGIILGINGSSVIIGEANCGQGDAGIRVRTISIEEASSGYKYMYTDGALKQDVVMGDIGG